MMGTRVSDLITSPRQRVVTWPFVVVTAVTQVFLNSNGVTHVTVQHSLGHSSTRVTQQVYEHLVHDGQLDAFAQAAHNRRVRGGVRGEPAKAAEPLG